MELLSIVFILVVFALVMAWLFYLGRSVRDVPRRRDDGTFIASSGCSSSTSGDCGGGGGGGGD